MDKSKMCKRGCLYSHTAWSWACDAHGCAYLDLTGHSRVKAVYMQLGVKEMTPEARELLKPENCPCFVPAPGKKKREPKAPPQPKRFDEAEFRALHAQGLMDKEIAARLGVGTHSVYDWRKKLGLLANFRRDYVYDWDKARELYDAGATDAEIMRALNCSRTSVQDWRKREGLITNYVKK